MSTTFSSSRYVHDNDDHTIPPRGKKWSDRNILKLRNHHDKTKLTIACAPQRNLNNAFAYDLVPSPTVITAALRAARRVNDYPTAVRIFEGTSIQPRHSAHILLFTDHLMSATGIKAKVENQGQYDEYVKELQPIREELGVNLKEQMYPEHS